MKKYIFLFLCICSSILSKETSYEQQAQEWIKTYICCADGNLKISAAHIQTIANLFYFSYHRSQATLEVQPLGLRAMNGLWNGWFNIIQTRLDPSKEVFPILCPKKEKDIEHRFWNAYLTHRNIAQSYAHTVAHVVHGTLISDAIAQLAIEMVREDARRVVTHALTDIKQHLSNLFNKLSRDNYEGNRSITSFISSYIPQLAQHSFITADELKTSTSREAWELLKATQEVGNYTWETIEKARSMFYQAYYKQLYEIMIKQNFDTHYFEIMFNQHGLIPENKREELLPLPENLNK